MQLIVLREDEHRGESAIDADEVSKPRYSDLPNELQEKVLDYLSVCDLSQSMRKVSRLSGELALGVLRRRLVRENFHLLSNHHILDETVLYRWDVPTEALTCSWEGFVVFENARCLLNFSHHDSHAAHAVVHMDVNFETRLSIQSTQGSPPFFHFMMTFVRTPHIFMGGEGDIEMKYARTEAGYIWPLWLKLSKDAVWRIISQIQTWQ